MRVLLVLLFAACDRSGPSCQDAIAKAAAHFGNADAPEVATMIGTCTQESWPGDRRACLAEAGDASAFAECLPGYDLVVPALEIAPSKNTLALVATAHEPVSAILFLDDKSEVATSLQGYFAALPGIPVRRVDRAVDNLLAHQYRVYSDGVVLVRGTAFKTIELGHGDAGILGLDQKIEVALAKLLRNPRKAYLTAGHGETTDPDSGALRGMRLTRVSTIFEAELRALDFAVAPLETATLATEVPADATIVFSIGPVKHLAPEELAALERYLDRGGALLVALDPTSDVGLDTLEGWLGVHFNPAHLADDKMFAVIGKTIGDHRFVAISKFAPHPTTAALSRAKGKAMIALDAGSLEPVPARPPAPKVVFTLLSPESSFLDLDNNLVFDAATETRGARNLAAAIEGPKFHALVVADADWFGDVQFQQRPTMIAGTMFPDAVRWLAGEAAMREAPDAPPRSTPSHARLAAQLELAHRGYARALALAIASPARDHSYAAGKLRDLQERMATLRHQLDDAIR